MAITISARTTTARVANAPSRGGTKSLPPPHLTGPQLGELESELRRELAALERRLVNERTDESGTSHVAVHDAAAANHHTSDTMLRRDAVTEALARLSAGAYGTCTRCAEIIPFGRLVAMPEVRHCLSCIGSP